MRSLARSLNPAMLTPGSRPGRDGVAMSHTAAASPADSTGGMSPGYEPPGRWRTDATFLQDATPDRDDADTQPRTGKDSSMRYPIDPFISAVELAAAIRRKEV